MLTIYRMNLHYFNNMLPKGNLIGNIKKKVWRKMLDKITDYILIKHVERKLGKYKIKLMHFIPGRIRLQSQQWKMNISLMEEIVKELQVQPYVFSVQTTTVSGSLVITYDASYVTNVQELDSWFRVLDQVYTTDYLK